MKVSYSISNEDTCLSLYMHTVSPFLTGTPKNFSGQSQAPVNEISLQEP
jgi:hypothetical protein